jgi:diguanylate cyclase (GGDEF)-like protein
VLAVCPPADEPRLRPIAGSVLDDYFIEPLTPRDERDLRAAVADAPDPAGAEALALEPAQIAEMFDAARSVDALEAYLAKAVGSRLGAPARWVDADRLGDEVAPVLFAVADRPRALVAPRGRDELPEPARAFVAAVQKCLPAAAAAARRAESLHQLAVTDHLTGAFNRRYFYSRTDEILSQASGNDVRVTLLLYDIDDFKQYNDRYGHAPGDEILRETARLMKSICREHDVVARIGGDEFAVLFWDTPRTPGSERLRSAFDLADRFRRTVETLEFRSLGPEAKGVLSISGGLASFPQDGKTCRELLRSADKALRAAKETGKNNIFLVGDAPGGESQSADTLDRASADE